MFLSDERAKNELRPTFDVLKLTRVHKALLSSILKSTDSIKIIFGILELSTSLLLQSLSV